MFAVDWIVLVSALLLLFAIASSKFSARVGVPGLVVFLAVGMLAGSEGIGGIAFDDYRLAHGIGTLALALILFDGGLRTPLSSFRMAIGPATLLATLGVVITALITGAAASLILEVPLLEGFLLGAIVGSTDAAAVFAALRGRSVRLEPRLASTLEVESGANDPMAVFLTVGLLEVLLGRIELGPDLLALFVRQMSIGAAIGVAAGFLAAELNNRVHLDAAGLYPILMASTGLLAYGAAATLGGSGFLSVYLAGVVLGSRRIVFQRGIFLFSDGMAWLAQMSMFVMLGLLSFPSRLLDVAAAGLAISVVLIFVARPIAIALLVPWFRFNLRETVFIAWVGLKGAVPVVLAIFPLMFGLENALLLFDVVFFVVLVSAITQGWSLPLLARRLGLDRPTEPDAPVTLEITSLRHVDGDIVEYTVGPGSRPAGRRISELALPDGAVVALVARGQELIPPRGSTRLATDDHVFLVLRPGVRALVDRVFSRDRATAQPLPAALEFPLLASTTAGDLEEFYGIRLAAPPERTLGQILTDALHGDVNVGGEIVIGDVVLRVREIGERGIEQVGLVIREGAENGF